VSVIANDILNARRGAVVLLRNGPGHGANRRVLLRAEIRDGERGTISHTHGISEDCVVVQADEPVPLGQNVTLQLSLRGHVAPMTFEGTVVAHAGSGEPGDPAMMTVWLMLHGEDERLRLAQLLARLDGEQLCPVPDTYRVLIVDDNSLVRDLFTYGVNKFFQQRRDVRIDAVGDGLAAWGLVRDRRYDLALVERYLPILDGPRLVERIRNHPVASDMLVVAISRDGPEARRAMLGAGSDMFLAKPIVLRDLIATLERLTAGDPPALAIS
jgi:CheY-like chemotaxis protein